MGANLRTGDSLVTFNHAAVIRPEAHWWLWAERLTALLLFVVSLPIAVITAGIILLLSRRTPLVAHRRVGWKGEPFWMFKFRTMWGAEAAHRQAALVEYIATSEVPLEKGQLDPRVTSRFAAMCRRHSIDELPQLLHVVSGRMSLVGPRPLTSKELEEHYGAAVAEVLSVRPGVTGLWQVMGRNSLTYRQRMRLDLFLVRKYSPAFCCRILWSTILAALSGRDAW